MISWGSGIFLFGALGILVPLIIHLLSKKAGKTIEFGSLRFLRETETKTMKSLFPSQWWLLLLRSKILLVLAVILAQPLLSEESEEIGTGYLIDPFLRGEPWFNEMVDSLADKNTYWLTAGYPGITEEIGSRKEQNFYQLLQTVPNLEVSKWKIISPLHQASFQGRNEIFPVEYEWIQPPVTPKEEVVSGYQKEDRNYQLVASFDEWLTGFELREVDQSFQKQAIKVHISSDELYAELNGIFKSALSTLQNVSHLTIEEVNSPAESDWLIWLNTEKPPRTKGIILLNDATMQSWQVVNEHQALVSGDLVRKESIQINLPLQLLRLFQGNDKTKGNSLLTIDLNQFSYRHYNADSEASKKDISESIWILLLVLLLLERWFSFKASMS